MRDGRSFDPILRSAAGGEWRTLHGCLEPADVAALVLHPGQIVGLRHRAQTRLLVLDIDAHQPSPSPYWSAAGPESSPALQRLITAAETVGSMPAVVRTPSGGWHLLIVLPEAVPTSEAAWLARALVARAALHLAPGQLEAFPSPLPFDAAAPRDRRRSAGFRLPGQAGGAVWIGGPVGWCDEPGTVWAELEAALDGTAPDDLPAWQSIRTEAQAACRDARPSCLPAFARRAARRPCAIAWTGPGQTNKNLGKIANILYQPGEDCEALGRRIAAAARSSAGFAQFASADSRQRLDAWARAWAVACIRRPPRGGAVRVRDSGRNHRLRQQALCRVAAGAFRAFRCHGRKVLSWPEREASAAIGVARNTFRKHLKLWRRCLAAALGSHPPSKVVGSLAARQGSSAAVLVIEDQSSSSLPTSTSAPGRPPPSLPPLPTKPLQGSDPVRQRERDELARWLAARQGPEQ